jgi:hypothetical protein
MPLREGVKLKSSRYSKRYELRRARHHGGELLPPLRHQLAGRGLSRVDERAEGGHARAHNLRAQREDLRAQREAAELFATERLASVMARTLDKLEELLASDDDAVAMRAVHEVLDHVIGAQQAATSTRARLDWTSICWPSARSLLVSWNGVRRSSCRERYRPSRPFMRKPRVSGAFYGADDGDRTRDPQLGKLMLYQLSYVRAQLRLAQA